VFVLYQYILTQEDRVPVVFKHREKIPQETFLKMFDTCIAMFHKEGKKFYNHEEIAKMMKKEYGFEDAEVEAIIYSPSKYPGLFKDNEPMKVDNSIQTPFDYQYWKQNKEKEG
jgi:hypothetical protein